MGARDSLQSPPRPQNQTARPGRARELREVIGARVDLHPVRASPAVSAGAGAGGRTLRGRSARRASCCGATSAGRRAGSRARDRRGRADPGAARREAGLAPQPAAISEGLYQALPSLNFA